MTESKTSFYRLILVLSAIAFLWVSYNFISISRSGESSPDFCLLKSTMDVPCPFCGTTRSVMYGLQGEWHDALQLNPLGIVVIIFAICGPLWIFIDYLRKDDSLYRISKKIVERVGVKWIVVIVLLLLLLLWFRNIQMGL